jgi:hypothetical protein
VILYLEHSTGYFGLPGLGSSWSFEVSRLKKQLFVV